jgi:putative transposase
MRLARLFAPQTPTLAGVRFPAHVTTIPYADVFGWLGLYAREQNLPVHGWCITPQGLHILSTPPSVMQLSNVIQAIGRHLAAVVDMGSIYVGRYKTALIEPQAWVLPTLVWLEQAPVRLNLAERAEDWRWSSAQQHTGAAGRPTPWLVDHPDFWACGNTPFARQAYYKTILAEGISDQALHNIESALYGQWALGSATFLENINLVSSRRASPAKRGRPKKVDF